MKYLNAEITADQTPHRTEANVCPPLQSAVTIPVKIDGRDRGVVVYVGVSPFCRDERGVSRTDVVQEVARRIREALA